MDLPEYGGPYKRQKTGPVHKADYLQKSKWNTEPMYGSDTLVGPLSQNKQRWEDYKKDITNQWNDIPSYKNVKTAINVQPHSDEKMNALLKQQKAMQNAGLMMLAAIFGGSAAATHHYVRSKGGIAATTAAAGGALKSNRVNIPPDATVATPTKDRDFTYDTPQKVRYHYGEGDII